MVWWKQLLLLKKRNRKLLKCLSSQRKKIQSAKNIIKSGGPYWTNLSGQILNRKSELFGVDESNPRFARDWSKVQLNDDEKTNKQQYDDEKKTSTKLPNGNLLYKCKLCGKIAICSWMKNHIELNCYDPTQPLWANFQVKKTSLENISIETTRSKTAI